MKYCTKCGAQMQDDANNCPYCGNPVNNNSTNNFNDGGYYQNNYSQPAENQIWGILSLIFGIIGGWLGIIFGIIGLCSYHNEADPNHKRNRNYCKAGIIICICEYVLLFVLIIVLAGTTIE